MIIQKLKTFSFKNLPRATFKKTTYIAQLFNAANIVESLIT